MNPRLAEIHARRALLVARSAVQRDALEVIVQRWRAPVGLVDQGLRLVHYARAHPGAVLLAVAALLALSPRRTLRWARRGVLAWRGYRSAVALLGRLAR
jgi:hypothetical protein